MYPGQVGSADQSIGGMITTKDETILQKAAPMMNTGNSIHICP